MRPLTLLILPAMATTAWTMPVDTLSEKAIAHQPAQLLRRAPADKPPFDFGYGGYDGPGSPSLDLGFRRKFHPDLAPCQGGDLGCSAIFEYMEGCYKQLMSEIPGNLSPEEFQEHVKAIRRSCRDGARKYASIAIPAPVGDIPGGVIASASPPSDADEDPNVSKSVRLPPVLQKLTGGVSDAANRVGSALHRATKNTNYAFGRATGGFRPGVAAGLALN